MIYRTRPGIVLLRICETELLAATREVWEFCPRVRPIPRLWAGCWALMEKGRTSEEAVRTISRLFQKPEAETYERLRRMFEKLSEEGFLIEAEPESDSCREQRGIPDRTE